MWVSICWRTSLIHIESGCGVVLKRQSLRRWWLHSSNPGDPGALGLPIMRAIIIPRVQTKVAWEECMNQRQKHEILLGALIRF